MDPFLLFQLILAHIDAFLKLSCNKFQAKSFFFRHAVSFDLRKIVHTSKSVSENENRKSLKFMGIM